MTCAVAFVPSTLGPGRSLWGHYIRQQFVFKYKGVLSLENV